MTANPECTLQNIKVMPLVGGKAMTTPVFLFKSLSVGEGEDKTERRKPQTMEAKLASN